MAEAFTSYVVDNDRRFRDAIKRASSVMSDLRGPFGQILADFYKSEQSIFALKGPGQFPPFKNSVRATSLGAKFGNSVRKGQGYDASKSPYQRSKIKHVGFDYPLLVRSGSLAASLLSASANGAVAVIGERELIIGTTIPYGIYHQSNAARKKIPLRKFLFIGPEAPQFATSEQAGRPGRWMNILNDWTLKSLKASGAFNA